MRKYSHLFPNKQIKRAFFDAAYTKTSKNAYCTTNGRWYLRRSYLLHQDDQILAGRPEELGVGDTQDILFVGILC